MRIPDFGFSVYGMLFAQGILVCIVLILRRLRKKHQDILISTGLLSIVFVFSIFGARVLYIITHDSKNNLSHVLFNIRNGFSYFGAIYMAIMLLFIFYQINADFVNELMDDIIFAIPLLYSFIKIGCLLSSCCYGIRYHGFGAVYYHGAYLAPNDTLLFPVQLVDGLANFILACYLYRCEKTCKFGIYCTTYGICRFFLEFLRSSELKTMIGLLSVDQIHAIIILLLGICFRYFIERR